MIDVSAEAVEQVETLLSGIPGGAERALASAMNRGLSGAKTGAVKKVKEVYTAQSSAVNEATTARISRASTGDLAGYISFAGYKIPLYKFRVTPKAPGIKQKVNASVKKGGGTAFEDAFIAQMRNGHIGVFERKADRRFPVEEKMGLAMAQMAGSQDVIAELEKEVQETVSDRLDYEIDRILNGYKG